MMRLTQGASIKRLWFQVKVVYMAKQRRAHGATELDESGSRGE